MRTFAFGDIHGCHDQLKTLLNAITPTPSDTLIFLGDIIDRGADSKGVLDTIRELEKVCHVIAIMGNHEQMMIESLKSRDALKFWLKYGGDKALQSFGLTPDFHGILNVPYDYWTWLKNLKPYHETDDFIFTHATPVAHLEMAKQTENGLRWRFLEKSDNWHCSNKIVICGHSSQMNGKVLKRDGLICIDTYAYGGQCLTALEIKGVNDMMAWQVDNLLNINKIII
ncbi:metallophosphoesterase family protein [Faucicola mancuniensis]|uniref:metallophosphoesterase family protein n=1 Tax=Faucicola mancuniensis TaxID=1309795 RepID=UPI0028E20C7F|nr:metallophosphoesterase family protein [uncultured Moraxella sp.]